ncbi:concanavalin A-like lectin/glucanase domain-containing protein [Irpex rosettiformis]|uniref:Concanavalin A-like lectin/glucanase domain-containing protein n=1 Tax=Irpex rosettiformis TaxID=378272 RepID=A0ACB8UE38_9APHY|nr:concanavalin A-like lectin/glucanase domain-containing protein [Irpex rosettiformis]
MKSLFPILTLVSLSRLALAANFTLLRDSSGNGFFDDWTFYGNYDNTTSGDVNYVNQAQSTNLAFVNSAGRAIIKVDNTSFVPYNQKRNSVRIGSKDYYTFGSVWVFDIAHIPYGCSVWPSVWSSAFIWPDQGEIDIVEGINKMTANQMALHASAGCNAATGTNAINQPSITNCNATSKSGCTVPEKQPNSYGESFASAGGGVWATQFDVSGIYIWFWSRANVPKSITTATNSIDISSWGNPSAAFPSSSCNIPQIFGPQQLIVDITLCGAWAGMSSLFGPSCAPSGNQTDPNLCYITDVINNGTSDYATAYFEFNSIRTYGVNTSVLVSFDGTPESGSNSSTGSSSGSSSSSGTSNSSGASSGSTQGSSARVNLMVTPRGLYAGMAAATFLSWLVL